MAAGATICTIHVEMNRNQLGNIFERLKPRLILYQDGLQLDDLSGRDAAPRLRIGRWDKPSRTRCSPSLRIARRAIRRQAARPDDDAVILFTSGTSAKPKGVVLNFREYLLEHRSARRRLRHHGGRSALRFPPVQLGLGADFWARSTVVNRGATLVLAEKFSASRFFRASARPRRDHRRRQSDRPSTSCSTANRLRIATTCRSCASSRRARRRSCSKSGNGSSRNSAFRSRRAAAPARSSWIAAIPGEQRRLGTVGRPFAYHDLAIVDADGRRLPPGEIGYVELGGFPDHPFRYLGEDGEIKIHSRGRIPHRRSRLPRRRWLFDAHRPREGT